MADVSNLLLEIAKRAEEANEPAPEDYIVDGILICGRCGTPRQTIIEPHESEPMKVYCLCECRQKALDEAEQKRNHDDLIRRLNSFSMMDERLKKSRFENFIVKPENEKCYKLLKSYADRFAEMEEKNQGLLLYGRCGTGKTFGAACIANQLIQNGISVLMTSFVDIVSAFQNDADEGNMLISRAARAKLLIIDDLGAERDTSFALEKVYNVIDTRYRSGLPMILTTNLSVDEMLSETDVRCSRIYDRIFEVCVPIPFQGTSWRRDEAAKRFDKMKSFMEGS